MSKVHRQAERQLDAGRHIIFIGHRGHPEVIGTFGQVPEGAMTLVETLADVASLSFAQDTPLAFLTQTTLSVDDTAEIIAALQARYPQIVGPKAEDICYATSNRQAAVKAIAPQCGLVLVIGAPNSSNSLRLVEVAERDGTPARLIQRGGDIDPAWLEGIDTLGITAGASAPEALVREVVDTLAQWRDNRRTHADHCGREDDLQTAAQAHRLERLGGRKLAVYTHLGAEDLAALFAHYDVGELVSAKGIAEGVSNSNWLVETTGGAGPGHHRDTRFILTMYERRIEFSDLPFFLGLLDHLAARHCPVPRTIHDREGAAFRMFDGKAVALIEFLPGVSIDHPEAGQARAVGEALAGIHLASADFPATRPNALGLEDWRQLVEDCGTKGLAQINPQLPMIIERELEFLSANWPRQLPRSVIHADLFPDNVLMRGDEVSGLIDFYFACNDLTAYDLAVTHAAWCFDEAGQFRSTVSAALLAGYLGVRALSDEEWAALPILARGASMRFLATRAYDWLHTPPEALVMRKDPMDFVRRMSFYATQGANCFTPG